MVMFFDIGEVLKRLLFEFIYALFCYSFLVCYSYLLLSYVISQ